MFVAIAAVTAAAASSAGGGNSIATAPLVAPGQNMNGNTAEVPRMRDGSWREFWKVDLRAGDRLTIKWLGLGDAMPGVIALPAGTDDFVFGSDYLGGTKEPLASGKLGANQRGQIRLTASRTGTYPFYFLSCNDGTWTSCSGNDYSGYDMKFGPYEFVVEVKQATSLMLRGPGRVRPNENGLLTGRLSGASAATVELQYRSREKWRRLGAVKSNAQGRFVWSTTFDGRCGSRWYTRAVYRGDATHVASVSNTVVTRASC